jgi:hypothetical protein
MAKNHLVKRERRTIGFVYQDSTGQYWYAFGRPSAANYIAFACRSLEHGIVCIEMHRPF